MLIIELMILSALLAFEAQQSPSLIVAVGREGERDMEGFQLVKGKNGAGRPIVRHQLGD